MLLSAQNLRAAGELIVPGVRVGPATRASTEVALIQLLGRDAAKQNVEFGEGAERSRRDGGPEGWAASATLARLPIPRRAW